MSQPMPYQIPGVSGPRCIVSVFPKEQSLELRHEGTKMYAMPAAPKGGHSVLVVNDTFSWLRNLHSDALEFYPGHVSAEVVAQNLLNAWSQTLVGVREAGAGPGIMICAGLEPTQAEIAQCNAIQENYFRYLINEGDFLLTKNQVNAITDVHRMAADWMGAQDREWAKPIEHVATVECPACAEIIKAKAKICMHCKTDLRSWGVAVADGKIPTVARPLPGPRSGQEKA